MEAITQLRRFRWFILGRKKIKKQIADCYLNGRKVKILIGAGTTGYADWIATDLPHFDILNEKHWKYYFEKFKIDNLLAEHVFEHLREEDVKKALHLASQYMEKGGTFRIAVPDQWHPNKDYIEYVRPNGSGPGCDDHKSFWNIQSLSDVIQSNHFEVQAYEYYDKEGKLFSKDFDEKDGVITRSTTKGYVSADIRDYSSLIVDAIKV